MHQKPTETEALNERRRTTLLELAPEVADVFKRYFRRSGLDTRMKDGKNDPVTKADLEADALIRDRIGRSFPDDAIITEETTRSDDLPRFVGHPAVWFVDPLDGTKNFMRGRANYASAIGFACCGKPRIGCLVLADGRVQITMPHDEDKRILFHRVAGTRDLAQAAIGMDLSKRGRDCDRALAIAARLADADVSALRILGSAASDSFCVAEGTLDAYIHPGLSPWDIAASAALILEAGGRITRLDGSPWNVFCPDVLATNGYLHDDLLKLING